jgi:hypothetical protein
MSFNHSPPCLLAGVDIIEAGFPIASPDDFAAVKAIAMDVGNAVQADGYVPVICGLSRTRDKDLETAWEAVRHAKLPRVHTFIATSGKEYRITSLAGRARGAAVDACLLLLLLLGKAAEGQPAVLL